MTILTLPSYTNYKIVTPYKSSKLKLINYIFRYLYPKQKPIHL